MDLSKAFDTLNHHLLKRMASPKILLITFKVTYTIVSKKQMRILISV